MWNFISVIDKTDKTFEEFICRSIYRETFGIIKCTNIKNINLKQESYRNVFVMNNYEINIDYIDIKTYNFKIYPIQKNNEIQINFGCELEICIKLECIKDITLREKNYNIFNTKIKERNDAWRILVMEFINDNLLMNIDNTFIDKFPYIFIVFNTKNGYTNYLLNLKTKKYLPKRTVIHYDYLIFTIDESIKCNDNSFLCEIVSPILYNIEDIKFLYEKLFINECFSSNESSGFHINISCKNVENPIYFSYTFIDKFLQYYQIYENLNYKKFRPKGSNFAKPVTQYIQEYTYKSIKPFVQIDEDKKDYFYSNFIENQEFYRSFISLKNKYASLYLKNPILLEFRVFPSESNFEKLLEYINDVFILINESYNDYYTNIIENSKYLQNINIKNIVNYQPLDYYKDYLYYQSDYNIHEIDYKNESELLLGLNFLLSFHNQKIKQMTYENSTLIVKNIETNELENFKYNITFDNKIEIIKN